MCDCTTLSLLQAELAEQIAAQQREKEAKRLAREREEAMEEATLAQEREKLNRQYQREVLEKRRKEVCEAICVNVLVLNTK